MQATEVYNGGSLKGQRNQNGSLKRCHELIMDENKTQVLRVNKGVDSTFFSQIKIFSSSNNIGFRFQISWIEVDNKIEL